jgi:hypothetical protein
MFRRGGIRSVGKVALIQPDAMVYGAGRQYVANLISPLTSQIPLGGIADEVGMGLVDWMVAKNFKSGFIHSVALKGLVIENAAIGAAIMGGGFGAMGAGVGTRQGGI